MIQRFLIIIFLLISPLTWAKVSEHTIDGTNISFWLKNVPASNTVSIQISFLGGSFYDPEGREGLADLAASSLFLGTKKYTELEFLEQLEDGSIGLNFNVSDHRFYASIYALKEQVPVAIDLMFDAILNPALPRARMKQEHQGAMAYFAEHQLQPSYKFGQFINQKMAGNQPLFSRNTNVKSIKKIDRKHIKQYLQKLPSKEHMRITVVGNITESEVKQLLQAYIQQLPEDSAFSPLNAKLDANFDGKTHILKQDVEQANIAWFQSGLDMHDSNYFKALILNEWLGGDIGILRKEIREKQGLTYSISTLLQSNPTYMLYGGSADTDNLKATQAESSIRAIWQQIKSDNQQQKGVFYLSEDEFNLIKQRFTNAWAISFSNNAAVNNFLMQLNSFDIMLNISIYFYQISKQCNMLHSKNLSKSS